MADAVEVGEKTRGRLRVGSDEEVLMIRTPSIFAFIPLYLIGLFILGIHLLFGWAESPNNPEWYEVIFYMFIDISGWAGGAGFAFVMLFFTWLNRMVNHPASGKWVTTYLLLVSLTPFILHVDEVIRLFSSSTFEIPFEWNFTFFGILWSVVMWGITFWYQKSFLYGITNERIILTQDFIYERDGQRILHEDIIAVHKQRSIIGAMCGYSTVHVNIGDQAHFASESTSVSIAIPTSPGDPKSKASGFIGFIQKLFIILTYQRTVKTERFTPNNSFYGIRKWEEAFDLINDLHRENSSTTKADLQLDALQSIQEMLSKDDEDDAEEPEPVDLVEEEVTEEPDEPLDDLDIDLNLD